MSINQNKAANLAQIVIGSVFATLVAAWVLSPLISSVVDRGFDGRPRLTAFHLALTLSDESARHAIRNSLIVAAIVTLLSTVFGVILARILAGGRFFGRDVLATLARAPGAYTPLIAAVGFLALVRFVPADWRESWRWISLGWIELAWAVPRVMAAVTSALSTVDPSWVDAARMAGVKRGRTFWSIGWPLARSGVSVAASEVFILTLFDPGAPLVLGLRNTLPVALIESALGLDREPRAAVLATLGLALGLAVRGIFLGSGQSRWTSTVREVGAVNRPAPLLAALGGFFLLGGWVVVALAPLVGLVAEAFALDRFGRVRFDMFLSLACDGGVFCALFHSLILGFVAAAVAFVFGWGIGPPRRRVSWRHPTSWPRVLPPLVLGLGALLLPGLLDSVALRFGGPFSRIFHDLADFADVYRSPWTILVLCGAVFQVPMLSSAFEKARLMTSDDQREVARTLGASRFWAWVTAAAPGALAIFVGVFSTAISAAAIASMPNILLSRTMAAKPVAPEIIELLSEPSGMRKAAGLACLSLLFPIASWVVCKAGIRRSGRTRLVRR